MTVDPIRLSRYLSEIRKNSLDLQKLIRGNQLLPDSVALKAVKYVLIELAEAMANVLQHILAKEKGISVTGYVDTISKGRKHDIISESLFIKLKPFFDFRNALIHRYWSIDDSRLIQNILEGKHDFDQFVDEIENYLN